MAPKAEHRRMSRGSEFTDAWKWVPGSLIPCVIYKKDDLGRIDVNTAVARTREGEQYLEEGDWVVLERYKVCRVMKEDDLFRMYDEEPEFLCGTPAFIDDTFIRIKFQHGDTERGNNVNGTTIADVIQKIANKVRELQTRDGGFPCMDNEETIRYLEMAAAAQKERTKKRIERKVEGLAQA